MWVLETKWRIAQKASIKFVFIDICVILYVEIMRRQLQQMRRNKGFYSINKVLCNVGSFKGFLL